MSVKILIDSASDIIADEAREMGVELVPIEVRFGEERYSDGVTLLPEQFYDKLIESSELPKTSQINAFTFGERFANLTNQGHDVVAIIMSSKLSGTYRNAVEASKKFDGKVFVVDSLNASIGERLLCRYALRLAEQGLNAKQIAEKLDEKKKKVTYLALLDTLHYLRKGGRVSAVTAFAGKLLSIKPVVSVIDGEVKLVGKAMGSKKGNDLLNGFVEKKNIDFDMPYGAIYSGNDKSRLEKYLRENEKIKNGKTEIPVYVLSSTVGAHIGPNGIGVAFFEK